MVGYFVHGTLECSVIAHAVEMMGAKETSASKACVIFTRYIDILSLFTETCENAKVLVVIEESSYTDNTERAITGKINAFVRKLGAVIVYYTGESIDPMLIHAAIEVYHGCQ